MGASSAGERRVLLKISGEAMCPEEGSGIDTDSALELATRIQAGVSETDVELALILGGGNFVRGAQIAGARIDRITADHMGMLATVMNALALGAVLDSLGVETRVLSAIPIGGVAETFVVRRADHHLSEGRVVLLAGGTGNPYFSTDTTASLRALQLGVEVVYKATKVDGVYSADPVTDPDAVLYEHISYEDVLRKGLRVMDSAAISMCMEHRLPIRVFSMKEPGSLSRALRGEDIGTLVD